MSVCRGTKLMACPGRTHVSGWTCAHCHIPEDSNPRQHLLWELQISHIPWNTSKCLLTNGVMLGRQSLATLPLELTVSWVLQMSLLWPQREKLITLVCLKSTIFVKHRYFVFNPLKPNNLKECRTTQLTSRCCILYIYSTNTRTEYFKHAA